MNEELKIKAEFVLKTYQVLFDKETSYDKCGVTEEEANVLDKDAEFQSRLKRILINEQERVLTVLRNLMLSPNEATALRATLEYGELVYPRLKKDSEIQIPAGEGGNVVIVVKGVHA